MATDLKHAIVSVLDNAYLTQKTCFGKIYSVYTKNNEQGDELNNSSLLVKYNYVNKL